VPKVPPKVCIKADRISVLGKTAEAPQGWQLELSSANWQTLKSDEYEQDQEGSEMLRQVSTMILDSQKLNFLSYLEFGFTLGHSQEGSISTEGPGTN